MVIQDKSIIYVILNKVGTFFAHEKIFRFYVKPLLFVQECPDTLQFLLCLA
jgi:hypothetical protein